MQFILTKSLKKRTEYDVPVMVDIPYYYETSCDVYIAGEHYNLQNMYLS